MAEPVLNKIVKHFKYLIELKIVGLIANIDLDKKLRGFGATAYR